MIPYRILPCLISVTVYSLVLLLLGNFLAMADEQSLIVDVLFGEPVPLETMLDDLATVRIVYLGEVHTIARHHEIQTQIIRQLSERKIELALGMEMFSVSQQSALDRWQTGKQDISALIKDLGKNHWTNLEDYRSVLLLARELGMPIFGLNAHDSLVRKVARDGLDSIEDLEYQDLLKDAREINPLYDRLLRLRLQVHRSFKDRILDQIVLAQSLRDAIMASATTRILTSPQGTNRSVIVIAGTGHLNYGFGIPERVHGRTGLPFRIVLPSESGELTLSEDEKRQAAPVTITHQDLTFVRSPIADYLHVIPLKNSTDFRHTDPFTENSSPVR